MYEIRVTCAQFWSKPQKLVTLNGYNSSPVLVADKEGEFHFYVRDHEAVQNLAGWIVNEGGSITMTRLSKRDEEGLVLRSGESEGESAKEFFFGTFHYWVRESYIPRFLEQQKALRDRDPSRDLYKALEDVLEAFPEAYLDNEQERAYTHARQLIEMYASDLKE